LTEKEIENGWWLARCNLTKSLAIFLIENDLAYPGGVGDGWRTITAKECHTFICKLDLEAMASEAALDMLDKSEAKTWRRND